MNHPESAAASFDDLGLLTVPEAARLLRISRNLTYELIAQHELPCVRFGRVIRVPRGALECWIREKASQTAIPPSVPHAVIYRS